MPLYPFETQLVLSQDGTRVLLTNAQVTIYDPSDTGFNNPIALVDNGGVSIANPIQVTTAGFLPAFQATVPQIMWLGGGQFGYLSSFKGTLSEAVAARSDAASSANAAAASKLAAERALEAAQAAAVAPTTAAINSALITAGSPSAWKANTSYVANQYLINPSNQLVKVLANHNSGATYVSGNYTTPAAGGGLSSVTYENLPGGSTITVKYGTSSYPARPTTRTDIFVRWRGPVAPTNGGTGAVTDVDAWENTTP